MATLRPNPNRKFEELKLAAAKARTPFDKDVYLNLAFYLDQHYVEWSDDIASVRQVPRQEGFENTPRPVVNKIMHFVAQEHAIALQAKPTFDVMPESEDPIAVSESNVSGAYLKWLSEATQADLDSELSDATMWALAGGEGFLKWSFNPQLKRPDVISVNPLDLYVDPFCKRFKNARYVIHTQFMDVEQVYDIWDKEIKPQDMQRVDPIRGAMLREMGVSPILQGVVVNELWLKPNRRYKGGLYVVWSEKETLVEPSPHPYQHKRIPFTQIGSVPRPGTPHYTCAVKYLRSPQMELNKYHAQRIMVREAFSNPKWWIDDAIELDSMPDDSPRQILTGNSQGGTLKPEVIQPTVFPGGDEGEWITAEMMNVVGLHEVSQGQVPGRVESSKAIEALKESDAGRLAELTATTKHALSEGGWQALQLARQYVSEEQILATYSRDGIAEVHRFKAEKQVKESTRVRVTMGTGLSRSRAAREEQLMNMWVNGILRDPEVMAELLEIPVGTVTPVRAADIRLARNENFTITSNVKGTAINANSWDDHEIHLREHNTYRKSSDYLALPTEVKTKFEFHCDQHDNLWTEQLQKQAQRQMAIQSVMGPNGGDTGSQQQQPSDGGSQAGQQQPVPQPAQKNESDNQPTQ